MLTSLSSVGPPLQDLPSWNSSGSGRNEEAKESFDQTLAQTMSSDKSPQTGSRKVETPPTESRGRAERRVQSQDDKEEVSSKKAQGRSETPLQKKATLARQKVIEKFMDSFEGEFGIPTTRLVEVMAELPAEELTKNPESTVDSVLAQLDLTDDQEDRAKEMYLTLISDLDRIDRAAVAPTLMPTDSMTFLNSQSKERFMMAQERKTLLNRSLDQMNEKFWMKSAQPAVPKSVNGEVAMAQPEVYQDPWSQREMMAEAGVDISHQRSQHIDEFKDTNLDYVVTVCDRAAESCPIFSGDACVVHHAFDDPPRLARDAATEGEALNHYRRVRDEIRTFVASLPESLEG